MAVIKLLLSIMAGSVCNLFFFEPGTAITSATGPENNDGSVTVSVLSIGEPTPRFILNADPPYSDPLRQTSGTFTGLVPGSYIVNCRTSDTCKKELTIIIPFIETWSPKYRLQYGDSKRNEHLIRFDIEERSYAGVITDVKGSASPTNTEWANEAGQNIFEPVIGSRCVVTLMSPSDGYFDELNTYDEKLYRGTYYIKESGVYVKRWQGFLTPMNSIEPYFRSENYEVQLQFTDGLQDLSLKEFSDDSGNIPKVRISVLDAIVFCLNKTNLQLNIHDAVNVYEVSMDTGGNDSTLRQLYFDPSIYMNEDGTMQDCLKVLKSLLVNLFARLSQHNGVWFIENQTLKTGSATPTRVMVYNGGSVSNSDIDYRIRLRKNTAPTPKLTFEQRTAMKEYIPMYGEINFIYDFGLEEVNNILLSGDFEDEDVTNGQLKHWQIDTSGAPVLSTNPFGALYAIETVNESKVLKIRMYAKYEPEVALDEAIQIFSQPVPITPTTETYLMKLSFDMTATCPNGFDASYIFFDFALEEIVSGQILNRAFNDGNGNLGFSLGPSSVNVNGRYIRQYITEFNVSKHFEFGIYVDPDDAIDGQLQLEFRIQSNPIYDYESYTDLGAADYLALQDTDDLKKRMILGPADLSTYPELADTILFYELEPVGGTLTSSIPDIFIPGSGDGTIESAKWVLKKQVKYAPNSDSGGTVFYNTLLNTLSIDNVLLKYLPDQQDPQTKEETNIVVNPNVKNSLDITFLHGDLPTDINYQNIAKGWFSLSDGTPTSSWAIRGITGPERTLMEMLQYIYTGQYGTQRVKLSGSVDCNGVIPMLGYAIHEVVTGRIYVLVESSIMDKQASATIGMIEALLGTPLPDDDEEDPDPDVEPPPVIAADFLAADFDPSDFNTA